MFNVSIYVNQNSRLEYLVQVTVSGIDAVQWKKCEFLSYFYHTTGLLLTLYFFNVLTRLNVFKEALNACSQMYDFSASVHLDQDHMSS